MRRLYCIILCLLLCACAADPPRWRSEAIVSLERARNKGAAQYFPAEFRSASQGFQQGEEYLKARETEDAERHFYLALLQGELLERNATAEKARRLEEERRAEALKKAQAKAEAEQKAREEERRLAQEKAEAEAQQQRDAAAARRRVKPQRERPLLFSYTVRRGESLPYIASQPEVFGDRNLWPLLYRANRDQIRDPRHIWPGQVLRIPRNVSRDDVAEARRYAQEKPLR